MLKHVNTLLFYPHQMTIFSSTSPPAADGRVQVVVGVLARAGGQWLMQQRGAHQAAAGQWEFPGGKIEPGETALAALRREMAEELGIRLITARPLESFGFDYAHAKVWLTPFRITAFAGQPHGREGQVIAWLSPADLADRPVLGAVWPILRALNQPDG